MNKAIIMNRRANLGNNDQKMHLCGSGLGCGLQQAQALLLYYFMHWLKI